MGNNKLIRSIDELGRIVLPAEVRQILDWDDKTSVEIWVNAKENALVIKRHIFTCVYCGKTENLRTFHKKYICSDCQKEIAKL